VTAHEERDALVLEVARLVRAASDAIGAETVTARLRLFGGTRLADLYSEHLELLSGELRAMLGSVT
jgi:hypothetical protein